MAFHTGSPSAALAEMNVTPLIDVLLVLLIIFMVIVPIMPRGLPAVLPQSPKRPADPLETALVVQLEKLPNGTTAYTLNRKPLSQVELQKSLSRVLEQRQNKALFVRGDRELQFSEVAQVIGWGRQANAEHIGILTPQTEAGQ